MSAKKPPPPPANDLEYRETDLADLRKDPANPRTISKKAAAALKHSVGRFGPVQPIVVNRTTGDVVAGHQRIDALLALGTVRTMVVYGTWSAAEQRALNVTLNNQSVAGDFDGAAEYLNEVLDGLSLSDFRALSLDSMFPATEKSDDGKKMIDELVYKIVITCADEDQQSDLLMRLEEEGLTVAPLIA